MIGYAVPITWSLDGELPAAIGKQLIFGQLADFDADHGLTEVLADFGDDGWVLVVRGGLYDGLGAQHRIT